MSVQLYCDKCNKHLGSVWPSDDADWNDVVNRFENMFAKDACDNFKECKYNESEQK